VERPEDLKTGGAQRVSRLAYGAGFALLGGTANASAVAIMGRFGLRIGVLPAITLAALVTTGVMLIALLFVGAGYRSLGLIARTPSWFWTIGLLSTFYGFAVTTAAPSIGVAATIALVVSGQIIGGIVVDGIGAFGLERIPLKRERILAVTLVGAGAFLSLIR
jgi:bacterial/archaeal transporter family-2 protein